MASAFWRTASRASLPLTAAYLSQLPFKKPSPLCDAEPQIRTQELSSDKDEHQESSKIKLVGGMRSDESGDYFGLFPKRQLWQPVMEYPLWDSDWDGKEFPSTGDADNDRRRMRTIRKHGVTRHLIFVRHGQYDERFKEDEKKKLTELGKRQAELTGQRLAEMLKGAEEDFGPCRIKCLRVSAMTRAKETADIIASYLPQVEYIEPDAMLNEGRPCHHIPGGRTSKHIIEATDHCHPRIENAFRKLFYRADFNQHDDDDVETTSTDKVNPQDDTEVQHEFEIIVCHANVIRYFFCRALQLPPEAWLRYCPFNCSLTYFTIRPTGTVSCRLLGDIGHLPYGMSTFSQHQGFNW